MTIRFPLIAALIISALLCTAARADDPKPDDVLKANGLTKTGAYYLTDADRKLPEFLRATQASKHKVDDALARRANLQRDLDSAVAKLRELAIQNEAETKKLADISETSTRYNKQVGTVNAIRSNLRDGIKFMKQRQQTMQDLPDPTDEYVTQVTKFADALDAVVAKYKTLAEQDDVKTALAVINKDSKTPMKLGPSEWFQHEYPITMKLKAAVATQTIQFDFVGGVPQVPVTLNGTVKIDMVVDSGAAIVSLTTETANKLGLKPGPEDKVVQLVSADGKITEAHLMTLKSVRLGNFTVENVQCAIQPPEVKGDMNLLGGTFLKHFVYRMDLGAGALKLSQIPEAAADPKAATKPK